MKPLAVCGLMAAAAVVGVAPTAISVGVVVAGVTAVAGRGMGHRASGFSSRLSGGGRAREGKAGESHESDDGDGDGKDGFHVSVWIDVWSGGPTRAALSDAGPKNLIQKIF